MRTPSETISLHDLAKAAGVSTSTVSRALAFPDRISKKTRDKILQVAEELGYHPNIAARNLRLGQAKTILAIMPVHKGSAISTVAGEAMVGLQRAISASGYALNVVTTDTTKAMVNHALDLLYGRQVSGTILMATQPLLDGGRSLLGAELPVVSLTEDLTPLGIPSVVSSDRQSMAAAVDMLVALGHRSFLYISGPADSYHSVQRESGVRSALLKAFGSDACLQKIRADFNVEKGVEAAAQYLALKDRPTAVISWADETAVGFHNAILSAGLSIPGDLSLVSFDGLQALRFLRPSISTFDQRVTELGIHAGNLLLDLINAETKPDVRIYEIPAIFRPGESIAAPPAEATGA